MGTNRWKVRENGTQEDERRSDSASASLRPIASAAVPKELATSRFFSYFFYLSQCVCVFFFHFCYHYFNISFFLQHFTSFFLFPSLSLPLFLSGQKTKITIIDLVCICCRLHFRVSKIMINIYRILMHQLFDFF